MNKGHIDEELIARLRVGDRHAFKLIYCSLYSTYFLFTNRIIRNRDEADDIVSDAMVKLWRRHMDMVNVSNIKGFLYLTCRNASYDVLRARRSHMASHREIRYLSREDELFNDRETRDRLLLEEIGRRVEELPPRCREVFELIFFERKKNREVARQLGISLTTVQGHRAAAIKKLRDLLSGLT